MADNVEDPFEDIDSGDEEIGRPATPDFHHGGEEPVSSPRESVNSEGSVEGEIKDEENGSPGVQQEDSHPTVGGKTLPTTNVETAEETNVADNVNDDENDDEDIDDANDNESIADDDDSKAAAEENADDDKDDDADDNEDVFDNDDDDVDVKSPTSSVSSEAEAPVGSEHDANETENKEEDSLDAADDISKDSSAVEPEEVSEKEPLSESKGLESEIQEQDGNDLEKQDVEKEHVEMPMSPIGDLGLSGAETKIADDIMKSDVTEMLPSDQDKEKEDEGSDKEDVEKDGDDENGDNEIGDDEKDDNEKDDNEKGDDEKGGDVNDGDENDVDDDKAVEVNEEETKHEEEKEEKSPQSDMDISDDDEAPQISQDKNEEESEPEEVGDQLIADIFGASDEEEEFEGFEQEDIEVTKKKKGVLGSKKPMISDDEGEGDAKGDVSKMVVPKPQDVKDESSDSDDEGTSSAPVWDFDVMMEEKKKANRSKRRRRGEGDIINDSDDLVMEMIKQMKEAAQEDRLLNEARQAATKKLKLLPLILKHLNKADLQLTFIDSGVLNVLKDWLSPLPDGSMPHLHIRTGMLKILSTFPALDTGALKMSGLGKAVMYIYRHPKEIRENKQLAGKLINDWARPIFGVTSNFKSLSREEREERDYQNMSKRRRLSSTDAEGGRTPRSIDSALTTDKKALRPGDKGFIMRARVPMPSNKEYVVRPKSDMDNAEFSRTPKTKTLSRADKQMRKFKENNKAKKAQRAVVISIEGRKMSL